MKTSRKNQPVHEAPQRGPSEAIDYALKWVEAAVRDLHRPLTKGQLSAIRELVDDRRQRSRPPSPDSSLPPDAGAQLIAALPALLIQCERDTLSEFPRQRSRDFLDRLRVVDRLSAGARDAVARMQRNSVITGDQRSEMWCALAMAAIERLQERSTQRRQWAEDVAAPLRRGRQVLLWRRSMLTQLAAWWIRQGWTPTVQPDGCFASVARRLRDFRIGASDDAIADEKNAWKPQTLRACIKEAERQKRRE